MLRPKIGKVVVNMSVGQSGESLQRAITVLQQLTNQRPCTRKAKKTIRDFGIRKGEPVSCVCTLRGDKAVNFLKMALEDNISFSQFDNNGNFSFGIREHISLPGVRYDPNLGIFGMDVSVVVEKPGYRVKRRQKVKSKIGKKQRISVGESMNFIEDIFGIEIKEIN
jgi:large subunit ribosomal protein L5